MEIQKLIETLDDYVKDNNDEVYYNDIIDKSDNIRIKMENIREVLIRKFVDNCTYTEQEVKEKIVQIDTILRDANRTLNGIWSILN